MSLLWAWRNPSARPVVIVCPASLKLHWQRECLHHFGFHADVLSGTKPPKHKLPNREFTIINYDVLKPWMGHLLALNPQLVIIDEGQYLGSHVSLRTKMCRLLCMGVPHVLILSGTPVTNSPLEMYPLLNILRPDLFSNRRQFCESYTHRRLTPWGIKYEGARNLPYLHRLVKQSVLVRMLRDEYIKDLPPKVRTVIPLPLSDRGEYERAQADFLTWLRKVSPARAHRAERSAGLAKANYLKTLVGRLKLPAVFQWVDDFLSSHDGKLILFAVHQKVVEAVHERYGRKSVLVYGKITGKKRWDSVAEFQNNKKVRLFVGNIKAAGVGLNLTAADTVAFCEFGWTAAEHLQAEDRPYARVGDMHGVSVVYLAAENTIETRLAHGIQKKSKVADSILDGKRKRKEELDLYDLMIEGMGREAVGCR